MSFEEYVNTANLRWRDQKREGTIKKIIKLEEDMVLAVTPISYTENFKTELENVIKKICGQNQFRSDQIKKEYDKAIEVLRESKNIG